jgi:NOL1/NOP2/fmu family ribosome biogenesis protein
LQIDKIKIFKEDDKENLERIIEKNYGVKIDLSNFFIFQTKDEKVWLASKSILSLDIRKLTVNSIGLNFGKIKRNEKIHLTIEGSQIVGKNATKNIVLLDDNEAKKFMQGFDVKPKEKIDCEYHNFVIVKYNDFILGSSLLIGDYLKNMLPKSRRILSTL